ncbi:MAG: ATP-binding cassette domain-containing protein, partial [Chloroflexi bacterium]|nr:ATP-binding cassette domain-containing protein [Chloroflexota bacterium]
NKADRSITGFSGGERQRLGIAQAQINHPDLLILDEPAAALDPRGRRDVLAIMERLRKYATIFYSTHILDDVQRVSDAVAILNHGELVAQDSIEALLAGSDGVVYQVTLKGDTETAHTRLVKQGWVTGVKETAVSDQTTWQISVSDEGAAEANLLRLLVRDEHSTVTEFGRRKYELEEIFLNIVEGGDDE